MGFYILNIRENTYIDSICNGEGYEDEILCFLSALMGFHILIIIENKYIDRICNGEGYEDESIKTIKKNNRE